MNRQVTINAVALTLAFASTATLAADSSERTSMPDRCSDRDANCVLPDNATPVSTAADPDDRRRLPVAPPRPSQLPSGPEGARPDGGGDAGPGGRGGRGR